MDDNSNFDRLGDLPLCLIHIILSFLPIKDAIRTCVLARQWRYIWKTLPYLDFSSSCGIADDMQLSCLIHRVLFHREGPVYKFKLFASSPHSCLYFEDWLMYLSMNHIRELSLHMAFPFYFRLRLHSFLYACKSLTHLELSGCELQRPPRNFEGFISLKVLILHNILDPFGVIRDFVLDCPLLEYLKITYDPRCPPTSILIASNRNLKYVELCNCMQICVYAPYVTEMSVGWSEDEYLYNNVHYGLDTFCNYSMLLGALINLEKLEGHRLTKYFGANIDSCDHHWEFVALKVIILHQVSFQQLTEITVLIRLLKDCPNVHKLEIHTSDPYPGYELEDPDQSFWDFGYELAFVNLKVVRLVNVRGLPHEMEFIKCLLKHSVALETLTISNEGHIEWLPKSFDILQRLSEAYPKVQVFLQQLS